jgi:hypothetical protein
MKKLDYDQDYLNFISSSAMGITDPVHNDFWNRVDRI